MGIGLLRGRLRSRAWPGFRIVLGILGCAVLMIGAPLYPETLKVSWFDGEIRGSEAVPYAIAIGSSISLLLYLVRRLIYSPKASAYFELKSGVGKPSGSYWFTR